MTQIDQQIQQMKAMAMQHYPDDEVARNAYLVVLLEERVRALAAKLVSVREV